MALCVSRVMYEVPKNHTNNSFHGLRPNNRSLPYSPTRKKILIRYRKKAHDLFFQKSLTSSTSTSYSWNSVSNIFKILSLMNEKLPSLINNILRGIFYHFL